MLNISNRRSISYVKPINLLIITFIATSVLWFYVYLPVHDSDEFTEKLLQSINTSDQNLCYQNFVWNDANRHLRFKYILDDDVLEKSNGKNIFFHLTNCIHSGIVEINAR